jgi:hypothetical protein
MLDRFSALCEASGFLPRHWGHFFLLLIDHTLEFFTNLPHRDPETEYQKRKGGEPSSQCFPNWPIHYERPLYKVDKAKADGEWSDKMCTKLFTDNDKHTPGLFLVCCACPQKKIYGFAMMIGGESPRLIFDIITTRLQCSAVQYSEVHCSAVQCSECCSAMQVLPTLLPGST